MTLLKTQAEVAQRTDSMTLGAQNPGSVLNASGNGFNNDP